jgi:hypothetical protein
LFAWLSKLYFLDCPKLSTKHGGSSCTRGEEIKTVVALAKRPKTSTRKKQRPLGVGTSLTKEKEIGLVKWINMLRGEGVPISSLMLSKKALSLGKSQFSASRAWQKRFRNRHRLALRTKTRQGQVRPADADARAAHFGQAVVDKMNDLGVEKVFNADQTGSYMHWFEFCRPELTL